MSTSVCSREVRPSPDTDTASTRLLEELGEWQADLFSAHPTPPVSDSHDAGTGLTPLATLIRASVGGTSAGGDTTRNGDQLLEYLEAFRDASLDHYRRRGLMANGYWRSQEAHHGPEYFQIFLYTLSQLRPEDTRNIELFADATNYVGNWVDDGPDWFDYEAGTFRSMFLGSEKVGARSVNAPDHLRCADLCLKCFRLTGERCYRDFALDYLRKWAEPVATGPEIPAALSAAGSPLSHKALEESEYGTFIGQLLPTDPATAAAENHVASGAVGLFLAAWSESREPLFIRAAERLIDAMLPALAEPAAWQVPALVRRYRSATGGTRYDAAVAQVSTFAVRPIAELKVVDQPPRPRNRFVGDRTDKPDWFDEEGRAAPNPVFVALRAEVTGDQTLWTRALDQSRACISLARELYGPYVNHGCTGKAVHAIARGHGRLDASGVITEVLNPYLGIVNPEVV